MLMRYLKNKFKISLSNKQISVFLKITFIMLKRQLHQKIMVQWYMYLLTLVKRVPNYSNERSCQEVFK